MIYTGRNSEIFGTTKNTRVYDFVQIFHTTGYHLWLSHNMEIITNSSFDSLK